MECPEVSVTCAWCRKRQYCTGTDTVTPDGPCSMDGWLVEQHMSCLCLSFHIPHAGTRYMTPGSVLLYLHVSHPSSNPSSYTMEDPTPLPPPPLLKDSRHDLFYLRLDYHLDLPFHVKLSPSLICVCVFFF